MTREVAHNRNGTARARKHSGAMEHLTECLRSHLNCRERRVHHHRRAAAQNTYFKLNPGRRILLHKFAERSNHLVRILIRNHPETHLRRGLRRNHRLRARSGKSTRNAVDFHRRPRPHSFEHSVFFLAGQRGRSYFLRQKLFLAEWQAFPALQFGRRRRLHIIVDTGNLNHSLRIFRLRQQLNQTEHRVRRRAAVKPGV